MLLWPNTGELQSELRKRNSQMNRQSDVHAEKFVHDKEEAEEKVRLAERE